MKYFAFFLVTISIISYTSEHSTSLKLKSISMDQALQQFNARILPTGTTVSQELNANNITLLFNREGSNILLRGNDIRAVELMRSLIQNYIDL